VPTPFLARVRDRATHELVRRRLLGAGVSVSEDVRFHGRPIVDLFPGSSVVIGRGAVLTSSSRHTALGVSHPVVLRTLHPDARIELGDSVGISGGSICAAVLVSIGDGTLLGADVTIADTDFHPIRHPRRRHAPMPDPRPEHAVVIGSNVFIGTRAIVLKGSRIGDDAVVGAGAVVSGDVPAGSIVAGNPSRPVGRVDVESTEQG
jgi:acetyltransferase-like isoleucine patch superfamily enzyme